MDDKTAIALSSTVNVAATDSSKGPGFACVALSGFLVYSCYWKPGGLLQDFERFLAGLEDDVRRRDNPEAVLIIAGDFNAKSSKWGLDTRNQHGSTLERFSSLLLLWSMKVGSVPTFAIRERSSVINITFARLPTGISIRDWRVRDDLNSNSDHRFIQFAMYTSTPGGSAENPWHPTVGQA